MGEEDITRDIPNINEEALKNLDESGVVYIEVGEIIEEDEVELDEAEKIAKRALKGQFTLEDLQQQLAQVKDISDVNSLMGMLPGVGKMKKQIADANIDDRMIARQEAIILSMTLKERRNPKLLNAKRRKRIAAGSGTSVQDVNRLLKQFQQMANMMKKMGKKGMKGMMPGMGEGMFGEMMPPPGMKF